MKRKWFIAAAALCAAVILSIGGCARKDVRHLASDVCLITPEKTTREQVLAYLGPPDEMQKTPDGWETWLYYEVRKSMLTDTPYIGDKVGDKNYEMVKVTFGGDIVQTCIYRTLSEEEFQQRGVLN